MASPSSGAPASRVLVVDDDHVVAEIAASYLRAAGFEVALAGDGPAALERVAADPPDLLILDRMLPGIDGVEVCRRVHKQGDIPVIMLTALGAEDDRIDGLSAGADDYVAKPFSPRELVLRVQSVLRRTGSRFTPAAIVEAAGIRLDPAARTAESAGEPLQLTLREFDLLEFLLRHPGQVFDRETLLRAVWGWEIGDLSTVTVHVRRLREKLERDPAHPELIVTVWGLGYRLEADRGVG